MSPRLFARKAYRRLVRLFCGFIQLPRICFYKIISDCRTQGSPCLNQPLQIVGLGVVQFFGEVSIGVFPSPFFLSSYSYIEARNATARVTIGDGTWINNGFVAIAEHSYITIGKRVLIGANVEIYDSDFHGTSICDRRKSKYEWAKPVVVGDDVFLASNVRILKGVSIGRGSIIANGSVVTKDIPPGVIAGGNPVRVIKGIE